MEQAPALALVDDAKGPDVEHMYETAKEKAAEVAAKVQPEHVAALPAVAVGQHSALMWILITCAGAVIVALLLSHFFGAKDSAPPVKG